MKILSKEDAIYIAGFFDGEGTCDINARTKRKCRFNVIQYDLYISITNTNQEIILWLKEITGIGNYSIIIKPNKKHKIAYVWRLRKYEYKEFLESVLPFLKIKKKQALIMLKWLEDVIIYHSSHNLYREETSISIEQEVLRDMLFEEIKILNKRGR